MIPHPVKQHSFYHIKILKDTEVIKAKVNTANFNKSENNQRKYQLVTDKYCKSYSKEEEKACSLGAPIY